MQTNAFHSIRWIHTRNVYIPMGYLTGRNFQAPLDPLILSLRQVSVAAASIGYPQLTLQP